MFSRAWLLSEKPGIRGRNPATAALPTRAPPQTSFPSPPRPARQPGAVFAAGRELSPGEGCLPRCSGLPALPFPCPWKACHDPEEALMWIEQASKRQVLLWNRATLPLLVGLQPQVAPDKAWRST